MQENRLRAVSAKYASAACYCITLHMRKFIRTRISLRWSSWSCRVTTLIAIVSAANYASTRTARTMVIATIRLTVMCANARRVTPRMTALLISTSALTTNVKTVRLVSMVSPITPVCAKMVGRDGCEYFFLFKLL